MLFQARAAVIADDEEWLNIPPVLRGLLRNLNEEGERNRALTEALRQEQRDTNILLRRLIQKQTDMELDFARGNLHQSIKAQSIIPVTEGATAAERQPDDSHTRRKLAKAVDRLKALEVTVKDVSSTVSSTKSNEERLQAVENNLAAIIAEEARVREQTSGLMTRKLADLEGELDSLRKTVHEHYENGNQQVTFVRQVTDNVKALDASCARIQAFTREVDKKLEALTADMTQQHTVFDRRFAALQHAVEGIHSYLENEKHRSAEASKTKWDDVNSKVRSLLDSHLSEVQQLFLGSRQQTAELEQQLRHHKRHLDEQTQALTTKQEAITQKIEQEMITDLVDASRHIQRLASKIGGLEDEVTDIRDAFSKLNDEETRRATASAIEQRATAEGVAALRDEVRRATAGAAEIEDNAHRERERLRGELETLRTAVSESGSERQRLGKQIARVCDITHDLSEGFQAIETRVQTLSSAVQEERQCRGELLSALPASPVSAVELSHAIDPLKKAIDEAARLFRNESEWRHDAQRSLTSQQDVTAQRLSQAERRLSELALGLDAYKETPTPTAVLPTWAEQSLRELSPTLVELESVKRRLVSLEARGDGPHIGPSSAEAQHREELQLQVADAVEDTRRRLLDLSRRVLAQEQVVASLAALRGTVSGSSNDDRGDTGGSAEDSGSKGNSMRAIVARLASDLTGVLEKLYVTEQSLSNLRTQTETDIAALREDVAAVATQASVEREEVDKLVDRTRAKLVSECIARHAAVEVRVDACETTTSEMAKRLDPVSVLDAVSARVAASAGPQQAFLQRMIDSHAEKLAKLADQVEGTQSTTAMHAVTLRTLSDSVSVLESTVNTLCAAKLEERQTVPVDAEATKDAEGESACATELAELRALLTEHAELVQTHAATLRDVVDTTLPALRGELEQRLRDVQAAVEADIEAATISQKKEDHTTDVLAQLAEMSAELKRVEAVTREGNDLCRGQTKQATEELRGVVRADTAVVQRKVDDLTSAVRALEERMEATTALATSTPLPVAEVLGKLEALDKALRAYAYPRAQLEERLENLWMSVVSLVARKEDTEAVARKLEELRGLVAQEISVRVGGLQDHVEAVLADKVGLRELQDIIESSTLVSGRDDDDDVF